MGSRRIALALVSAFGLVVVLAAAAWACTATAEIGLSVSKGKPGAVVDVSGSEFPRNGRVDVYWEPNPGEPRLLLETDQSSFAQPVTIPGDAAAGTHYVKAYGYGEDGELRGSATASFTVPHGTVAGQINDTDSGEGVHGAKVSVVDGGEVLGTVQTEADGTYQIGDLEEGAYTVTARRPGYEEASTQAEIRLGETSDVSFTLTRQAQDDTSDSGSGDQQPDGSQTSQPEGSQTGEPDGSQTSEPEGSQAPRGSEGAEPQGVESEQPEDSPAQGTTLEGSSSGGPTPQESTAPEADGGQQTTQPEQPAEDDPARQAIEPEPEPERQTVGAEASQGGPGGDTAASQPQSVGEPEPTGGQAQPSTGEPAEDEPAAAADTASEPNLGEAPADQAVPEPEAAEAEAENRGHPAVGPDGDAQPSGAHPSARSGSADLWSGLAASDVATLGSDQPATGQSGETSQALVLAVGLLGAGLLTLASGGAVAARRRRAPAEASTTPRSG